MSISKRNLPFSPDYHLYLYQASIYKAQTYCLWTQHLLPPPAASTRTTIREESENLRGERTLREDNSCNRFITDLKKKKAGAGGGGSCSRLHKWLLSQSFLMLAIKNAWNFNSALQITSRFLKYLQISSPLAWNWAWLTDKVYSGKFWVLK